MFECQDCGRRFNEFPIVHSHYEDRGYYGSSRAYEECVEWECPYCGKDDVVELVLRNKKCTGEECPYSEWRGEDLWCTKYEYETYEGEECEEEEYQYE